MHEYMMCIAPRSETRKCTYLCRSGVWYLKQVTADNDFPKIKAAAAYKAYFPPRVHADVHYPVA